MRLTPPTNKTMMVAELFAFATIATLVFYPAFAFLPAILGFIALYLGVTVKGM